MNECCLKCALGARAVKDPITEAGNILRYVINYIYRRRLVKSKSITEQARGAKSR